MRNIEKLLQGYPEINDYVIRRRLTKSAEWFFIGDKLDQSRRKEVTYTTVKLFVDDQQGKTRGHAEITIYPTHTAIEIKDLLHEAVLSAKLIKNQSYALPDEKELQFKQDVPENIVESGLDIIDFIFDTAKKANGDLNSFEVFVNHNTVEFFNKNGLHLNYSNQDCYLEVIVNAKTATQEIELYKEYNFGALNKESLANQFNALFTEAKDRAKAALTPKLEKADLILSNDNVEALLGVYESSTNAGSLYNHMSNFEMGQNIQENAIGDTIDMTMLSALEGSIYNTPIDADGVILKSSKVIENGVFTTAWGDARHSYYMSIPATGSLRNVSFKGGSKTIKELEKTDALEVLDFSSFIVDESTGDFSGEIRLGYVLKNGTKTAISGGSISGNLLALHHQLYLSQETQRSNRFEGPIKLRLCGVSVAGIQ
jgi:predicted Zn-dependent protease